MAFQILIDPPASAAVNMQTDERMFAEAEENGPSRLSLRFYSWRQPALSFGYSQKIVECVDINKAEQAGIELVKRLTGGGIVLHQPGEFTYCLIAPLNALPDGLINSCNYISGLLIHALQKFGIQAELAGGKRAGAHQLCFARPAKYEVLCQGKKLIGSAQKRGRKVLMQHGSIQLDSRLAVFGKVLNVKPLDDMQINIREVLQKRIDYKELAQTVKQEFLTNFFSASSGDNVSLNIT